MTRNDNQFKLILQEQKYRKCVVRILISCFRIRTNVSCTTTVLRDVWYCAYSPGTTHVGMSVPESVLHAVASV